MVKYKFHHRIRSSIKLTIALFTLLAFSIVLCQTTDDGDDMKRINCKATGRVCQMETCRYKCKHSCFKGANKIHEYGSSVYFVDSGICRAALHDLRISRYDDNQKTVEVQILPNITCVFAKTFGNGLYSEYYHEENNCMAFKFTSPRISENLLDVTSIHQNYLFGKDEEHIQYCFASSSNIKFVGNSYNGKPSISRKHIWKEPSFGVDYHCVPNATSLSIVTSIAFSKHAAFLPSNFMLTKTANIHETVKLMMHEHQSYGYDWGTKWMKDNYILNIPHYVERTNLILYNVTEATAGIYSLGYSNNHSEDKVLNETIYRGFMRLIVRTCPEGKFGGFCNQSCPFCLNGGMCHDITGECICAPGFSGTTCDKVCYAGYLGKHCNVKCPSTNDTMMEETCKGLLICLPDPYGCSCSSGFSGIFCNETCSSGNYGANCLQTYNVLNSCFESCDVFGYYNCCIGWKSDFCNETYPVLKDGPTLVSCEKDGLNFSYTLWLNISSDPKYFVIYMKDGIRTVSFPSSIGNNTYIIDIRNLTIGTKYSFRFVVNNTCLNKLKIVETIPSTTFSTLCGDPLYPPFDIKFDTCKKRKIDMEWKLPENSTWNCWGVISVVKYKRVHSDDFQKFVPHRLFFSIDTEPFATWSIQICICPSDRVETCSEIKCSGTRNITSKPESPPSPTNLAYYMSSGSIKLSWEPPYPPFGELSFYLVTYEDLSTDEIRYIEIRKFMDDCSESIKKRHCCVLKHLITDHTYKIELQAFNKDVAEGSEHVNITVHFKNNSEKGSLGIILGLLLPLICVCGLLTYLLFLKYSSKIKSSMTVKFFPFKVENEFMASNEALDAIDIIETESLCEEPSNRIPVENLLDYLKTCLQDNKIRKEYTRAPNGQVYPSSVAKMLENKPKNRYGNILPYDHSRVVLDLIKGDIHSDYIHASYIHGYKKLNRYIATQGPLSSTICDFWRMIWKEGCCKILMITNLVENGKMKCEKYWPDSICLYGNITVSYVSSKSYADFIVRTFNISKGRTSRELKHFHFITWPDHGVPSNTTPFVNYLKNTREYEPESEAPVVIHCSAGIGRTGTTVLLDIMIDMGIEEGCIDMLHQLWCMRKQRMNMVENYGQYLFVHYALLEILYLGNTSMKSSNFITEYAQLKTDEATKVSRIDKEFEVLSSQSVQLLHKDVQDAYLTENVAKNRFMHILPPDHARPFLPVGTGYINAIYIDSYFQRKAFVATQYPLPGTVIDFWAMIYEMKSETIVVVQNIKFLDPECPQFWPSEGIETIGAFQIECKFTITEKDIMTGVFCITNKDLEKETLIVTIFKIKNWLVTDTLPLHPSTLLSTISKIHSEESNQSSHVITAVCLDGTTACGIFCTFLHIVERIKAENIIDVFHAVKCVKANRPQFIVSKEQYNFLYELVLEYLHTV